MMTYEEREELRKKLIFPRDRIRQKAVESPLGKPAIVFAVDRGRPALGGAMITVPWCVLEDGFVYDPFDIHGSRPGEDGRVDIARRTRSLVSWLKDYGIEDITHPDAAAECEEEWSPDYAIICDAFSPFGDSVDGPYFDEDRCIEDFKKGVRAFFACDPTVEVLFHNVPHGSNEIEVTRKST